MPVLLLLLLQPGTARLRAAADRGQTEIKGGETGREGGRGVGFLDTKRVYLICDQPVYIKDPCLSLTHTDTCTPTLLHRLITSTVSIQLVSRCFTNPLSVRALFDAFALPLCAGPCGPTTPSDLTR